jgi:hypothetical protein
MKNVVWLSLRSETPARGYWDQHLLELAFKDYNHSLEITDQKEAIVIIPGAYQAYLIDEINQELSKLDKCVVIITSDEENNFPIDKLRHKNMKVFATYPTVQMENVGWLPIGYPPHAKMKKYKKSIDWFFAGQVNHESRRQMVENVKDLPNGELRISGGFAQGLDHEEYCRLMSKSKIVLCPNGNISPDSFRLYETLEAGGIPIVESEFFNKMFKNVPFPIVGNSLQWRDAIVMLLQDYNRYQLIVNKWWKLTKINLFDMLRSL